VSISTFANIYKKVTIVELIMTSDFPDLPDRDRSTLITAIVCSVLIACGAIAAFGVSRRIETGVEVQTMTPAIDPAIEAPISSVPTEQNPTAGSGEAIDRQTQIVTYWLQDTGTNFELMPMTETVAIDPTTTSGDLTTATIALDRLLSQVAPNNAGQAIPAGVTVNRLERQADGIYLDLSPEFTSGGGSASMQGRLAQVVYTVTEGEAETPVWLSIAGEPLTLLGGEGLEVPYPITRETFEANFSL
jgi:spore germination protein GerM